MACLSSIPKIALTIVIFPFLLLAGCSSPASTNSPVYAYIEDREAADLLQKSIEAAGGLETWQALKLISFKKHFALYAENGEIEQDVEQVYIQRNDYVSPASHKEEDADKFISYQLGADFIRVGGDVNVEMEKQALRNSMLSASFVISLPFKLLDEGSELSYAGIDTLQGGREVEVLKVIYDPQTHENHSTQDIWWHYFDATTYEHLAYMVKHADHFSYVENISQMKAGGIMFPLTRRSWRVDENRSLLWLRAEYEYSHYQVAAN